MPETSESKKSFESGKLIGLGYLVLILFAFTWAKEFLLPIVLAILISFLLAPVVSRLERWGFHPVLAVLSVATFAFALLGSALHDHVHGEPGFGQFAPKIPR